MAERDRGLRHRLEKYKYLWHVVVALIAGGLLIFVATRVKEHETSHDVLNEFGIAIVIAAIVTLMYETYAREVLASETMTRVVETVMGDLFDTQLWDEMRTQLLRKTAVRRAFSVTARIERDPALPPTPGGTLALNLLSSPCSARKNRKGARVPLSRRLHARRCVQSSAFHTYRSG